MDKAIIKIENEIQDNINNLKNELIISDDIDIDQLLCKKFTDGISESD